jgi:hypothetical protein
VRKIFLVTNAELIARRLTDKGVRLKQKGFRAELQLGAGARV